MKRKIEWHMIRGAIGVFLACLLLSGALLSASFLFRDKMQKEFDHYQNNFRDVSQKYLSVDGDEKIIRENYPRFIELYNRGVIGAENRLNWVETLESSGKGIKLPGLRYQIESRKLYEPEYPIETGAYELFSTNMKLSLGLLHEVDLAKVIGDLNKNASGLYNFKRCSFVKTSPGIETDPDKSNVNADCELQWYSLNLIGGEEIKL